MPPWRRNPASWPGSWASTRSSLVADAAASTVAGRDSELVVVDLFCAARGRRGSTGVAQGRPLKIFVLLVNDLLQPPTGLGQVLKIFVQGVNDLLQALGKVPL